MATLGRWLAEQQAADQRRFLHLLAGSFVGHLLFVLILSFAPHSTPTALPSVLNVDLVALPSPGGKAPARSAPAPKPVPPAAKPAPPPKPLPKQVVLPKEAPTAVPSKRVAPPTPKRAEPIEYEDAISQLRDELGEETPSEASESEEISDAELEATTAPGQSSGGAVDREIVAWVLATQRHVRSRYITPSEFLNRALATGIEVRLTSAGGLVGTPRVVRSSGDPFFDDNAVSAVLRSAPLPAPPSAGSYQFMFTSEER